MLVLAITMALYAMSVYSAVGFGFNVAMWNPKDRHCPYDKKAFGHFIVGCLAFACATAIAVLQFGGSHAPN